MIIDAILEFFLSGLNILFDYLPEFSLTLPDYAYSNLSGWAQCLGYLVPLPLCIIILTLKWHMKAFKIVMALIVRIKSFVPFWGS